MKNKVTKALFGISVFLITICPMVGLIHPAFAETLQTITLISGNGLGSQDPANQFTLDGGATFQNAYIVTAHPAYGVIPETRYINCGPSVFSTCGLLGTVRYKTFFTLPGGFSNASMTIEISADNAATIYLNGVQIGQQPQADLFENYMDMPDSFAVMDPSLFVTGINTIEFDIIDFGVASGFDYKAEVSFTSLGPSAFNGSDSIKTEKCK